MLEFPAGASGKEATCHCRRCKKCEFDPWVGKIPWRRVWQTTPVYLPGESQGQRSLASYGPSKRSGLLWEIIGLQNEIAKELDPEECFRTQQGEASGKGNLMNKGKAV